MTNDLRHLRHGKAQGTTHDALYSYYRGIVGCLAEVEMHIIHLGGRHMPYERHYNPLTHPGQHRASNWYDVERLLKEMRVSLTHAGSAAAHAVELADNPEPSYAYHTDAPLRRITITVVVEDNSGQGVADITVGLPAEGLSASCKSNLLTGLIHASLVDCDVYEATSVSSHKPRRTIQPQPQPKHDRGK